MVVSSCGFDKNNATISDLAYNNNSDYYEVYIKENGQYVPFLVLESDYQKGKTLLLRKDCLPEFRRFNDYSSYYENSEIDRYLNDEYIYCLDDIKDNIESVDISIASEESLDIAGTECTEINRKVYLLSLEEVCLRHPIEVKEGHKIKFFKDRYNRRCMLDDGTAVTWILRTPATSFGSLVIVYTWDDKLSFQNAFDKAGIRPAFCIDSSTKVTYENNKGKERFFIK